MIIKWKDQSGHFGNRQFVGYLGANLQINYSSHDGEHQPYSIVHIQKPIKKGGDVIRTPVLYMDEHYGSIVVAKERVSYLAKCLYYGIEPVLTDLEKKHLVFHNRDIARAKTKPVEIHGINVNGVYYSKEYDAHVVVKLVTNVVAKSGNKLDALLGAPSVVFENIFNNSVYSRTVSDFKGLGFLIMENK